VEENERLVGERDNGCVVWRWIKQKVC